ncbi:MAG: packaged DNA stabilization protein [Pseudomonadota bacterium]
MPDLKIITTTIRRGRGNMPQMPLVNMFSEAAITEPRQFALQSFPGLTVTTTLGTGPVAAMLQGGGILDGALAALSGGTLYTGGVARGAVSGAGAASIAGNEMGAVAAAGMIASFYDGAVFSAIDFPDGQPVIKVFEQGGRFLFIPADGQDWYWTAPYADMLDGSGEIIVDGLDFASAESEPDQLVDGLVIGDSPILGGRNTIEFWTKTGDLDLPYVPVEGRTFQKGVRATGCMALFDNTFGWVSPDNIVYIAGNVPQRISDAGVEELIAASVTCRVDSYFFEGHEFLKIGLDDVTVEFDAQTRQWNERRTGVGNFRGGPVVSGPLFGSTVDGSVYELSGYTDLVGYQERSFCAGFTLPGGAVPIRNVRLRTNPGQTEYLTGDYTNPTVELIQSFDGGQTLEAALPEYLGEQGEYRREVEWRALGIADAPGFFGKFRVTAPVPWRVSGAGFNEAGGGRSR